MRYARDCAWWPGRWPSILPTGRKTRGAAEWVAPAQPPHAGDRRRSRQVERGQQVRAAAATAEGGRDGPPVGAGACRAGLGVGADDLRLIQEMAAGHDVGDL